MKSTMGNVTPSLGELSAIDQVIDSLQIQRGNPNLKSYMSYYTELNYEFRKGLFYVNALGAYEYQPDAIMDEKYLEGNKMAGSAARLIVPSAFMASFPTCLLYTSNRRSRRR